MAGSFEDRAAGCLLGQLAGDSLGSLVEFETPRSIRAKYPDGVRELADGGTHDTLAGQPTDDSEMALTLARSLVELERFDREAVKRGYVAWLHSDPFDCGNTIRAGLNGYSKPRSEANGALMRISPLGIFGARREAADVMAWAREDAAITHPNEVCLQASALFAAGIAFAIHTGAGPEDVVAEMRRLGDDADARLFEPPPDDYVHQMGWVLIAFPNAIRQLHCAESLEEGVVDTVMRGGDTDTNAAIAGALLGAVHGLDAIPAQWRDSVLNCRAPGRPEIYWPVDALELAYRLA